MKHLPIPAAMQQQRAGLYDLLLFLIYLFCIYLFLNFCCFLFIYLFIF